MSQEKLIEVRNINKTFGPTVALKDVSMTFYRGEIRGLVGENGSGKSTVTSIIVCNLPAVGRCFIGARHGVLTAWSRRSAMVSP